VSRWVLLPAHVTPDGWRAVQTRLKVDMRQLFAEAGIRFRIRADRVAVAADDPGPLVYALPLQAADGRVRASAARTLARDMFGGGLDEAAAMVLRQPGIHKMDIDRWMGLRLALHAGEGSPRSGAGPGRGPAGMPPVPARRYTALMRRQFVWRVLEHLVDGIAADAMPLGSARQDNMLLTGLLEAVPGALVCAPLTARFQPMAAVLMTSSGAEVAMLAYGSGFVRMPRMDPWPVGVARPSLTGPGKGIYQVGVSEPPINHAAMLLQQAIAGVNQLLCRLTDPAQFAGADGCLDRDEQMIAWASVRFGFDAINSTAAAWGSSDGIWSAFRALGILQGLWKGPDKVGCPFPSDSRRPAFATTSYPHLPTQPIAHGRPE